MSIMESSKLTLLSEKLITPSSPTPQSLRDYRLSYMDQLLNRKYLPLTLFFPGGAAGRAASSVLEESLSKLLTFYYPYAGRLVDNISVDCNDMGALYREVQIGNTMSEILKQPFSAAQSAVQPGEFAWEEVVEGGSLAVVQLNHFECGGKGVSLCLPQKLGDANTVCNFLLDWAAMARESRRPSPRLAGSSILPPSGHPFTPMFYDRKKEHHSAARRLRFDASKIDLLKAIVASQSHVKNPTSTEVVAAILNRCLVNATVALSGSPPSPVAFDPFAISIPFNLRKLTRPPLQKLVGNLLSFLIIHVSDDGDLELPTLVSKIRRAKSRHVRRYSRMHESEIFPAILQEKRSFPKDPPRLTTSVCMYPFYEADFGWGTPSRVSIGASPTKNNFILFDAPPEKGGGVDVVATLDESVMPLFECHDELLEFSSLDPSF